MLVGTTFLLVFSKKCCSCYQLPKKPKPVIWIIFRKMITEAAEPLEATRLRDFAQLSFCSCSVDGLECLGVYMFIGFSCLSDLHPLSHPDL